MENMHKYYQLTFFLFKKFCKCTTLFVTCHSYTSLSWNTLLTNEQCLILLSQLIFTPKFIIWICWRNAHNETNLFRLAVVPFFTKKFPKKLSYFAPLRGQNRINSIEKFLRKKEPHLVRKISYWLFFQLSVGNPDSFMVDFQYKKYVEMYTRESSQTKKFLYLVVLLRIKKT